MRVEVRFLGIYRDLAGSSTGIYEIDNQATVGDLIETLVCQHPDLERFRDDIRVLLDGRGATRDEMLAEENEIVLVDPISGG